MHLKKAEAGFDAPKTNKPKQQQQLSKFVSCSVQKNSKQNSDNISNEIQMTQM